MPLRLLIYRCLSLIVPDRVPYPCEKRSMRPDQTAHQRGEPSMHSSAAATAPPWPHQLRELLPLTRPHPAQPDPACVVTGPVDATDASPAASSTLFRPPDLAWSCYGNLKKFPISPLPPYVSDPLILFSICMDVVCLHTRFVFWEKNEKCLPSQLMHVLLI